MNHADSVHSTPPSGTSANNRLAPESPQDWLRSLGVRSLAHQFNLGLMYANGQDVSKDETEAIKWYRLAADQGRSDAQYQLGHLSYQQNKYAEAEKWFRLAGPS